MIFVMIFMSLLNLGPDEGRGVGLELAVHAGLAVHGVAVRGAVHGLHLQDALDGVPDADICGA